jgi:hypothetical protein
MDLSAKATMTKETEMQQEAFRVAAWCRAVQISRSGFYALPEELKPRSIVLGRRRLITESPRAWLERISATKAKPRADYSHLNFL